MYLERFWRVSSYSEGDFIRHARLVIDAWYPYEYYRLLMINWRREAGSRGSLRALPLASGTRGRPGSHHAPRRIVRKSALNPRIRISSFLPSPLSPARFLILFSPLSDWSVHFCPVKGWFEWTSSFKLLTSGSSLRLGRGSDDGRNLILANKLV